MRFAQFTRQLTLAVGGCVLSVGVAACSSTPAEDAGSSASTLLVGPPTGPTPIPPHPVAPACGFTVAPAGGSGGGGVGAQTYCTDNYLAAVTVETASRQCPTVYTTTGYWEALPESQQGVLEGPTGGPGSWTDISPSCALSGLASNCCVYIWYPSAQTDDPDNLQALCNIVGPRLIAVPSCEFCYGTEREPCQLPRPAGGGCTTCIK